MKTIYRLLSLNLVLILVSLLCIFPISAVAAKMSVGGVSFGMDADNSGEGWSYTSSDKTLTLDGYNGGAICASGDLVIYSKNEVTVTADDGCGISVNGNLSLTSNGELSVTGGDGGAGILAKKLDIQTDKKTSVSINGGKGANAVKANELTIEAEILSAKGGDGASAVYFTSSFDVKVNTDAKFYAGTGSDHAVTFLNGATYEFEEGLKVDYNGGGATLGVYYFSEVYGDIDLDSEISISDAVLLAQHLADWDVNLSASALEAADVYHDGVVDAKDAVLLAQFLADWDVILGK